MASPVFTTITTPGDSSCCCKQKANAEQVEDLCTECPVVIMLNDPEAIAHVRRNIRLQKEMRLPAQYQQYCYERLEHHVNLATQLASEIDNLGWSRIRMEVKFHNKAAAKLYRDELAACSLFTHPTITIEVTGTGNIVNTGDNTGIIAHK